MPLYLQSNSKWIAHVAELVDAADSKSAIRKGVKVRFLSWALSKSLQILRGFCFSYLSLLQPLQLSVTIAALFF